MTVLHQKQLPSYSAERFYILSELQMNSVPPTFLSESNLVDDSMTAETVEVHSLEGSNSHEASQLSLPLQLYSILYLVWKPRETKSNETGAAITTFCNEAIVPAVHKIQGITRIRRPSIGQSSSSSSLSRYGSEDDFNDDGSEHQNLPDVRQPLFGESDSSSPTTPTSTRLYLVVEQVPGKAPSHQDAEASFSKLERCATELARCISTHTELRDLVQGVTVGVSNQERAAPGLEACMNALHVGSQDRRRHGISPTPEEGSKSLIGLVTDSYTDLVGPEDHHSHDHGHRGDDDGILPPILQQCLVTAEWSAAGDLATFAHRAHNVWRDQHRLPALSSRSSRKKPIRRTRAREVGMDTPLTAEEISYQCAIFVFLVIYFFFHYRNDAAELIRYML